MARLYRTIREEEIYRVEHDAICLTKVGLKELLIFRRSVLERRHEFTGNFPSKDSF